MDSMKLCKACGLTLPLDDFYTSRRERDGRRWKCYSSECKKCHNKIVSKNCLDRSRINKAWAVDLLGGKCQKCAGVFHPASFDFHHRDPSTKCFDVCSHIGYSRVTVSEELKKCDLLCSNCHRELEAQYGA